MNIGIVGGRLRRRGRLKFEDSSLRVWFLDSQWDWKSKPSWVYEVTAANRIPI